MALAAGTRVGPYEVIALIGQGGMGEVYRARDTRLGRDVALKTLPESLARDPDRLARFSREAHVLAALNHPNIAALYGLEADPVHGGVQALAMEFVEGRTLADCIALGAMPLDESLAVARQIAQALEAAHEAGIVHRDLKPANIKVRDDGAVKVLDFGLAKALEPAQGSGPLDQGDVSISPTITSPAMTQQGVILGTAAYMSPEQARGKVVDKRADIWAFGCVLSEMLTGRRPFPGGDLAETMAAIIKEPPDLTGVTPDVLRLVRKCLEKDPRRRLRDIADAWDLVDDQTRSDSARSTGLRRPQLVWIGALVLAAGALGAIAASRVGNRPEPSSNVTNRFVDALPENITIPRNVGIGTALAASPDGRAVVYRAQENGQFRLYRRFLGQLDAAPIGDIGAAEPFFSPDGQWVGFNVGPTLKRVPVTGGTTQTIVNLPYSTFRGASWGGDGTILLGGGTSGLQRVPETGGEVATLVDAADGHRIWYPQLLPGHKAALYTDRTEGRPAVDELAVVDLGTRTTKTLLPGFGGRYIPTGHVIFARASTLWAVAFDLGRLEAVGSPRPVLEEVFPVGSTGMSDAMQTAVTDSGALLYIRGSAVPLRTLAWVNRQGVEQTMGMPARAYANPRVSPDGRLVALTMRNEGRDVWIWDISRQHLRQLTSDPEPNLLAEWFPDGKRLAVSFVVAGVHLVHWQPADGSGSAQLVAEKGPTGDWEFPNAITRGGSLLYSTWNQGAVDIGVHPREGRGPRRLLVHTAATERNVVASPDDRWLAFESNRTGRNEIYVRPFPNVEGGEWPITREGGTAPLWARDGTELFYWKQRGTTVSIMAVPIAPGSTFSFGESRELFSGSYANPIWDRQYDVAPDGRFVMMKAVDLAPRDEIVIVQNWFEELKRLVPLE